MGIENDGGIFQATPGHATGVDAPLSTTTWAEREKGGRQKGTLWILDQRRNAEIQPKVDVKHIIWTYLVYSISW